MCAAASNRRLLPKLLFALTLAAIALTIVHAALQKTEWNVPEDAKKVKNPVAPSEAGLKAARAVFLDNCAQCHGDGGKGDGTEAMMYDPPPADLTDAKRIAAQTDGELFWKISEGKKPMTAFKKRLTAEQRWQLVLLVRSFAASAKPESPDKKTRLQLKSLTQFRVTVAESRFPAESV